MKLKQLLCELLTEANLNANFNKWFNGSKIVDGGRPMVVYHGSPDADIKSFKTDKIGSSTDSGMFGKGFYFTNEKSYADTYNRTGTGKTYALYLSIKNPLIIKDKKDIPVIDVPNKTMDDMLHGAENYSKMFTEWLIDNGYDGVIDDMSDIKQYIAIYPRQIKSVDNDGTWSNSENINS